MSLKFFFHRRGVVVILLNMISWVFVIWHFLRGEVGSQPLYLVFVFFCLVITVIRFIPWYPKKDRGHGIELHFEKTLVPTGYIMVVTGVVCLLWINAWAFLVFVNLLLLIILAVDGILIYFHFRDQDATSPSYFARSLYLKE